MSLLEFAQQPPNNNSTSVMSIGAIISPCSGSDNISQKLQQSSIDSTNIEYQLPPLNQQIGSPLPDWSLNNNSNTVGHWVKSSTSPDREIDMFHGYGGQLKRMRFASEGTIITSTPSSSFSTDHDEESDSNSSYSSPIINKKSYSTTTNNNNNNNNNWLNFVYKNNIYTKEALETESLLNNFDIEEYEENIYATTKNKDTTTNNRKTDPLATRRARNKLASAKYRAKKQALTHAMQDRIMQLATQVMSLRDELSRTRKNETEILTRYEKLVKHCQQKQQQQCRRPD